MTFLYGLDDAERQTILDVFSMHPDVETAILYGSRVTGRFRPGSDVDVVLQGENLDDRTVLDIQGELRDSDLPYIFDIVNERDIDEVVKNEINRHGTVFYQHRPDR